MPAHADDDAGPPVQLVPLLDRHVVQRVDRQPDVVPARQVVRQALVGGQVSRAAHLGTGGAQRGDVRRHAGEERLVPVAEPPGVAVERGVDQHRAGHARARGRRPAGRGCATARSSGRAGTTPCRRAASGSIPRTRSTDPRLRRPTSSARSTRASRLSPKSVPWNRWPSNRLNPTPTTPSGTVSASRCSRGDVPLPAAVAVRRGVRQEQPAAADDDAVGLVDELEPLAVEDLVRVDRQPAGGLARPRRPPRARCPAARCRRSCRGPRRRRRRAAARAPSRRGPAASPASSAAAGSGRGRSPPCGWSGSQRSARSASASPCS